MWGMAASSSSTPFGVLPSASRRMTPPSGWGAGVVADHLQAKRIDRREMGRDVVPSPERWSRPCRDPRGGVAAEQGIVVADAEDPAGALDVGPGSESFKPLHDVVDRVDGAIWRASRLAPTACAPNCSAWA